MIRIARFPLLALFFLSIALVSACGGGGGEEENLFDLRSELVVGLVNQADGLAFTPDGRLFYAEHWTGEIWVVTADGELLEEPFATITKVVSSQNFGLTGLALDPDFESNHYVYAYFTELVDPGPPATGTPTVIRFTDVDSKGTDRQVIVDDLPETDPEFPNNANGSIHFGADGFLYITLGDYDVASEIGPQGKVRPQDLGTPIGKMLRVQKEDGTAPADNPFVDESGAGPLIFAYGFRRGFDFAVHPETGQMYGSDSTGVTCEELSVIEEGGNHGWPEAGEWPYNDCLAAGKVLGIHHFAAEGMEPGDFQSTVGVTGMEFVSGDVYPTLGDSLLICEQSTGLMRRLVLEGSNFDQVVSDDIVVRDCSRDIAVSGEGIVYYSNEGEIRRLVPSDR